MNLHQDSPQKPSENSPKKSGTRLILKLLGAALLIFFLLFMTNKVVKNEVSTLIEQKKFSS